LKVGHDSTKEEVQERFGPSNNNVQIWSLGGQCTLASLNFVLGGTM